MAPGLSIQRPYSITSLPRPVNQSTGRYVVGDVHGGMPGSRKRKRAELAVGIDGEGLNLYDVQESRLITSYAIPPQYSFTCAPCSTRTKENNSVIRRSYISTVDDYPQITLFRDVIEGGKTSESTSIVHKLKTSEFPIVYMASLSPRPNEVSDLLIVRQDGQIKCLGGEKLNEIWTSSSTSTIVQDDGTSIKGGHSILYAQLTDAFSASKGLLKGVSGVLSEFRGDSITQDNNLDVLAIITSPLSKKGLKPRTLHVVALPQSATVSTGLKARSRSVQSLLSTNFPTTIQADGGKPVFDLHASTGVLHELCGESLVSINLDDAIPKPQKMHLKKSAQSFLRLSSTAIVTSSKDSVEFYNPKYMSIQTTVDTNSIGGTVSKTQKRKSVDYDMPIGFNSCKLISYFSKLDLIVGIAGSELVALQVETSQERPSKRRASGLLRDSLGCGMRSQKIETNHKSAILNHSFTEYLPILPDTEWGTGKATLDGLVKSDDVYQFDVLMANYFGTTTEPSSKKDVPTWIWPQPGENYPEVDQRSILYALGQIFSFTKSSPSDNSLALSGQDGYHLFIAFYPQNTLFWLIETGNLTVANIELALKQYGELDELPHVPAGEFVNAIATVDPEMALLLSVISKSYLSAYELLHAIRVLMDSFDIFSEGLSRVQLLTSGEPMDGLVNGEVEAQLEREQAAAEMAIEAAEFHLEQGSSTRSQALSMALEKLYAYPASEVVRALRDTFTTSKIVSLILILRHELIRGSWTSRYVDRDQEDEAEDNTGSPNSSIVVISNLLNSCIDAVGTGGWLLADSALVDGIQFEAEDLISSLKLEVSAALQGIDEATYIKGLTGEMLRFAKASETANPEPNKKGKGHDNAFGRFKDARPIVLPAVNEKNAALLPVGLKFGVKISTVRIGAGGELKARSKRDIGRLKSRQVGRYTLERIVI